MLVRHAADARASRLAIEVDGGIAIEGYAPIPGGAVTKMLSVESLIETNKAGPKPCQYSFPGSFVGPKPTAKAGSLGRK